MPRGRGGRGPRPANGTTDPTALTTAALDREIEGVSTLVELQIAGLKEFLRELSAERIKHVEELSELQFGLIERQRVEQKTDTKDALTAALDAAKEAVGKTEIAVNKALDQLSGQLGTAVEGLRREIGDLKERMSATTGGHAQMIESRQQSQWGIGTVVAVVGLGATVLIACLGIAVTIVIAIVMNQ